ncbi:MAG: hypothetical protein ACREA0_08005 [bacterium]
MSHFVVKPRIFIVYLLFLALASTWSSGFGGPLYQTCPAQCCAPEADPSGCSNVSEGEVYGAGETSTTEGCTCNSTCDGACSECAYFHAGAIQSPASLPLPIPERHFHAANGSLQNHRYPSFRPPDIRLG